MGRGREGGRERGRGREGGKEREERRKGGEGREGKRERGGEKVNKKEEGSERVARPLHHPQAPHIHTSSLVNGVCSVATSVASNDTPSMGVSVWRREKG